ncbi:thiol-disulfide oxidoreductase ResA [Bhargavaea beijingensis]|uniref:Peroxiredoxin n=1 Tax=Bhargavaea beijingensis TaxID=426756 RepID=A0A1G7APA2_9BACL|nr:thiol-disulfide oxidoreductase ResA [Bhargavaea beijingensis]MCW1928224.1 thiol-disulfide oxidoreductase ResA [Bhargavaea beijingensis]RSK37874.1 thiol-disulfide oxidoreductase ResA [Bhargavaea beijingensis]SDE16754.1 Peroxiredoxin [Bhargavaea beijingensis]
MTKQQEREKKRKRQQIIRTAILAVLAIAIVYTIVVNVTKDEDIVEVGDTAPDFELVDLEGNTHRLSDYRGEGVFLNFWGTWCGPCKKEMPHMEKYFKEFEDKGVNILAVNIAESDLKVQSFANTYGLTFPIVIDKTNSVRDAYNVRPLPTTFLVGPDGKVKKIIQQEMSEEQIKAYMESIMPS